MTSALSFQGISSGVQTDALVSAIMAQDSLPLVRLQNQQAQNTSRSAALNTLQTDMTKLSTSLQTLQLSASGFDARTVSSSDTSSTYVSGTASGTTTGNYDLQVNTVATAGRILPTALSSGKTADNGTTTLSVADASGSAGSQIFSGGTSASFAVRGTDGVAKVVTLTGANNSLNGLVSAINASGAGVTASIVNTGAGTTPYQMVLTANATGTGTTGGVVSLADVTNNDGATTNNNIGIAAGTVNSLTAPTTVTGGLQSAAATDAVFTVNGIQLTRQTNKVTDAVPGLTLTLRQGGETSKTTLTVAEDTSTITASMQDVITKYNTLMNDYTSASKATKGTTGDVIPAALSNDSTARGMISQVQAIMTGIPAGMPSSAAYQSMGDLGITANSDGTLSMDTNAFSTALSNNPQAAKNVFDFTGTTSNGVVNFSQGSAATTARNVAFNITSFNGNTGAWSGTLAADGGPAINVSGGNGGVVNSTDSGVSLGSLAGLQLMVTGTGGGNLSLTKGVAQSAQDLVANLTSTTGTLWNTLQSITSANTVLGQHITQEQELLNTKQDQLETQFAEMEATVAQMKAASGGLAGA